MTVEIIVAIALLVVATTIYRPGVGALLIWPILMCYPHGLWYQINPLPMSAGFDDVFIVIVTIVLALPLRRWRIPWSVGMTALFALVISIGNAAGILRFDASGAFLLTAAQELGKTLIMAMLGFCVFYSINHEKDLRRHIEVITLSVVLGAITVIISGYSSEFATIFGSPTKVVYMESSSYRPAGAFAEPNAVGSVMAMSMGLVLTLFTGGSSVAKKVVLSVGAAVMVAAVLLARSRSGVIGLSCLLPTMLLLRGMRKSAVFLVIFLVGVFSMSPALYAPVLERVGGTFDPLTGELSGAEGSREEIWVKQLGNMDAISSVFGNGRLVTLSRGEGGMPHSGYLDLFCFSGVFGVLWFVFLLRGLLRRIGQMMREKRSFLLAALGRGLVLFTVALLWCSLWSDTLSAGGFELILLTGMLALADRATVLQAASPAVATRKELPRSSWRE